MSFFIFGNAYGGLFLYLFPSLPELLCPKPWRRSRAKSSASAGQGALGAEVVQSIRAQKGVEGMCTGGCREWRIRLESGEEGVHGRGQLGTMSKVIRVFMQTSDPAQTQRPPGKRGRPSEQQGDMACGNQWELQEGGKGQAARGCIFVGCGRTWGA